MSGHEGAAVTAPWHEFRSTLDDWDAGSELLDWKTLLNPAGRGYVHLERRGEQLVGMMSVFLRRVLVCGELRLAAEMGNAFTHPDFRGQGIHARCVHALTKHCQENGIAIMYGTPNQHALPAVRNKRSFAVVDNASLRYLIKILTQEEFDKRARQTVPFLPASVGSVVCPPAHRLVFRSRLRPRTSDGIKLEFVQSAPADVDGFWGRDRSGLAFFTVRDVAYLDWRYFTHPAGYVCLAAFDDRRVVGFAAARLFESQPPMSCALVDIMAENDSEDVVACLVGPLERTVVDLGASVMSACCSAGSPYHPILRKLGFAQRRRGISVIVHTGTMAGRGLASTRDPWHLTYGDTDNV